jgi:CheY-like chemotaxis protein/HPt (histidine-containing phosphotransfer) domain-containing protein
MPQPPDANPDSDRRILVAEDNPANQKLTVAILGKLGYPADVVASGTEAVDAVTRSSYGAVLMDCEMPRMDGYEAATEIRRRETRTRRTPIIAMTAAALEGDRERCLAAGMDDYVSKPVHIVEIDAALRRWLGGTGPAPQPSTMNVPPPASGSSLDPRRVAELRALRRGDEPSAFSLVAKIFLRDTPNRFDSLRKAALEGDPRATESAAHYLKGAAHNIGAVRMADLCGEFERLGRSRELGGASDLLAQLDAELDRVRGALGKEMERDQAPH